MKKKIIFLITLILVAIMMLPVSGVTDNTIAGNSTENFLEETYNAQKGKEGSLGLTILYTNDIHTHIENEGLRYSNVAAMKKAIASYSDVLLVDAGDHIQGTAYGSLDKGEHMLDIMIKTGYDVMTLGNHEFDYGVDHLLSLVNRGKEAGVKYISCNFFHVDKEGNPGETVLPDSVVYTVKGEFGEKKIGILGITTPESFTGQPMVSFQDENGNFIYEFAGGDKGEALYMAVQSTIDRLKNEEGADVIIALGHLGDDVLSGPWTSEAVIANTTGLDAFIDGHSHSVVEGKTVYDKTGRPVILTQTGEYLNSIGCMSICFEEQGVTIHTELINEYIQYDSEVKNLEEEWIQSVEDKLEVKIGYTDIVLDNYDAEGNRLVRMMETNSGDLAADALYYLFDSIDMDIDAAIVNSGNIRNKAITGDISYMTCKNNIHLYGNKACLRQITGRQLLEALEWGAREVGKGETSSFLQVSGLTYEIDVSVKSTVKQDEKEVWIGGPEGEYRVKNVKVYNKKTHQYEPLDVDAEYDVAGYDFFILAYGDGFAMFEGGTNIQSYVMDDYMVVANYIKGFENGYVSGKNSPLLVKYPGLKLDYSNINGSSRINIYGNSGSGGNAETNDIYYEPQLIFAIISLTGISLLLRKKNVI